MSLDAISTASLRTCSSAHSAKDRCHAAARSLVDVAFGLKKLASIMLVGNFSILCLVMSGPGRALTEAWCVVHRSPSAAGHEPHSPADRAAARAAETAGSHPAKANGKRCFHADELGCSSGPGA